MGVSRKNYLTLGVNVLKELESGKLYRQTLIDAETGEILQSEEFVQHHTWEKKATFYKKNEVDSRTFLNVRLSAFPILAEELSCTLLGHAIFLATLMKYDGCLYQFENSKLPLQRKELAEIMAVNKNTLARTMKQLIAAEVLQEVKVMKAGKEVKAIKMNPVYFYRGQRNDSGKAEVTTKLFTETMQQLYAENGAAKVGFFCKLLPYLDRDTNIICSNPQRVIKKEAAKPLGIEEIAAVTGVDKGNVSRYLNHTQYSGKYAFAKTSAGAGKRVLFTMSPELAAKTKGTPAPEIMQQFIALNEMADLL